MQAPEVTVAAALRGLEKNTPIVIPGLHMKLAMWARKVSPEWVVRLFMRGYGRALADMA